MLFLVKKDTFLPKRNLLKKAAIALFIMCSLASIQARAQQENEHTVSSPHVVETQKQVESTQLQKQPASQNVAETVVKDSGEILPEKMPSLFFTYWQHEAITDAKNSRGYARPPTEAEMKAFEESQGQDTAVEKPKPRPEEREITVGGIVYRGANDWTVWMNGKRIKPDAIPKEVIDFRVYDAYVEFKWLDSYTNQIFPLRMRSHQRFNLDTRIFLTGP